MYILSIHAQYWADIFTVAPFVTKLIMFVSSVATFPVKEWKTFKEKAMDHLGTRFTLNLYGICHIQKAQNIPLHQGIPSIVSINIFYCLLWCLTLATPLDMNIELCFCLLLLKVCSQAEIKHYKSRVSIELEHMTLSVWMDVKQLLSCILYSC